MRDFSMAIEVTGVELAKCSAHHEYDESLEDVRSVIGDACAILAQNESVAFVVTGFCDEVWPVDVETDLATVLEQLPMAIRSIQTSVPFTIDFFEQGTERVVDVSGSGDELTLVCGSRETWQPTYRSTTMRREALLRMLRALASRFYSLVESVCEDLATNKWLVQWRDKIVAR